MSSRQYITRAIVCGSKHSMTSDKSYLLFTQELGMLWATARSVRMEKSKQRYALQDFSLIRVSLVQGKAVWRIGSVEALSNPFLGASSRAARGGVSFVLKAVRRYIHGEEAMGQIFLDTQEALSTLCGIDTVKEIEVYQQVFMIRMLHELGYITNTPQLQEIIQAPSLGEACDRYTPALDVVVTKSIEHASQVSHL